MTTSSRCRHTGSSLGSKSRMWTTWCNNTINVKVNLYRVSALYHPNYILPYEGVAAAVVGVGMHVPLFLQH